MDELSKQLRELPAKFKSMPAGARLLLLLAALVVAGVIIALSVANGSEGRWQYAFTNLSPEDSSEAAAVLKTANIPFRLEAGGAALAVPNAQVYDARLLLAAQGLPRGGGVGFELFDRGDLGVSEFTQKINLRRALEGELARTVSRLSEVRSARVHLTLGEKGLYKDEDRKSSAAIVLNLQPGRKLSDAQLAGVRHLVASAVPGLAPESVTVVDGRGAVLATDGGAASRATGAEHELESNLESRIVSLLEPVVGQGAVVARVTASLDTKEVSTSAEVYDPDSTAVRSERKLAQQNQQEQGTPGGGVAGAAANTPLTPLQPAPAAGGSVGNKGQSTTQDETRNFEVSRTTTTSVDRAPRITRLSVAVLLDGVSGKPRPDAEVARLGELAKRAVGFDDARGDVLEISSAPFSRSTEDATPAVVAPPAWIGAVSKPGFLYAVGAVGLLFVLVMLTLALRGGRSAPGPLGPEPVLRAGARVAEIEAQLSSAAQELGPSALQPKLNDPNAAMHERARELAKTDPQRAALLLRAWISSDTEKQGA